MICHHSWNQERRFLKGTNRTVKIISLNYAILIECLEEKARYQKRRKTKNNSRKVFHNVWLHGIMRENTKFQFWGKKDISWG